MKVVQVKKGWETKCPHGKCAYSYWGTLSEEIVVAVMKGHINDWCKYRPT